MLAPIFSMVPDGTSLHCNVAALGEEHMATILIVEDETTILLLVESVLQHAGYETLTAGTLAEAQSILQSDRKLDLIFTDIELGEHKEGGIQVGEMVGQIRLGTPVVYASGRALTDGMQNLLVQPSAYLPKPYTDQKIIEAVAGLLRDDRN